MCSFKIKKLVDKIMYLILIVCSLTILFSCKDEIMDDLQHSIEQKSSNQDSIAQLRVDLGVAKIPDLEDYKTYPFHKDFIKNCADLANLRKYDYFPSIVEGKYDMKSLRNALLRNGKRAWIQLYAYAGTDFEFNVQFYWKNKEKYGNPVNYHALYHDMLVEEFYSQEIMKNYVEVFVTKDGVLTPAEAYNLSYEERMNYRMYQPNNIYYNSSCRVIYVKDKTYAFLTGIPMEEIEPLPTISFDYADVYELYKFKKRLHSLELGSNFDYMLNRINIRQFPHKDNYKDYQNNYRVTKDPKKLKRFIKPGSIIYVRKQNGAGNITRHIMVVLPKYYQCSGNNNSSNILSDSNGYKEYSEYENPKYLNTFFYENQIRLDMFNDNISLSDFLKRFIFIESTPDTLYLNTKMPYYNFKGVKLTSGNDKYVQDVLLYHIKRLEQGLPFQSNSDAWVEFGVFNIHESIIMSLDKYQQKFLFEDLFRILLFRLGNIYGYGEIEPFAEYCSGLIFNSYKESIQKISLLRYEDRCLINNWYMPKTLIHSPYVYGNIVLVNKQKYPH